MKSRTISDDKINRNADIKSELSLYFDEKGNIKPEHINQSYDFGLTKKQLSNTVDISPKEITIKPYPNIGNLSSTGIVWIKDLVNEAFGLSQKSTSDQLVYSNMMKSVIAIITQEYIFDSVYNKMVKDFTEAGANSKKITKADFKGQIDVWYKDSLSVEFINKLYSLFLWTYGTSLTKEKLKAKEAKSKQEDFKIYNAPLSQKYQVPDMTNLIYQYSNPQKIKTLFTECKQMLLVEYNESRIKKSKKDANVEQSFEMKISDFDPSTNTIKFKTADIKNKKMLTGNFFITQNNKDFWQVTPNGTEGEFLNGIIYTDKKIIPLKSNDMVSAAETFGAKYDISATPADKRQSTFWKKLKKTSDIIGFTGADSIFKTAAGETVSALGGHLNDIRQTWGHKFPWEREIDPTQIKAGDDAHIRYCILLMFKDYLDWKVDKINIKSKKPEEYIPICADHLADFDSFVKWMLESTNYTIGEFLTANPELERNKANVKTFFNTKKYFTGGVGSDPKTNEIIDMKTFNKNCEIDFISYTVACKIIKA